MNRELNFEGPSPLLYLVATPIGNLSEMTPRAISVLNEMDFVAAEDTRNSGKLLAYFHIDKPFISCHEHNEEEASAKIVALLQQGKKIAYMSDAGYPTLSDPGSRLVANCLSSGIKVSVLSGPSAAINALSISGLDSSHFYFHGFLSAKESEKTAELKSLAKKQETMIFYESPHRIEKTLHSMASAFGDERRAAICRELTKAHEEVIRGTFGELNELNPATLRGEMVIVVEGALDEPKEQNEEDYLKALNQYLEQGMRGKEAVAKVASDFSAPKNLIYSLYIEHFKS